MSIKSRSELQSFFVTGAKPSQQNFTDLTDSYLHTTDALPQQTLLNAMLAMPVPDLTTALRGVYYEYSGRLFIVDNASSVATDDRSTVGDLNISIPYKTIQAACTVAAGLYASEGNTYSATIVVQPGFYSENVAVSSMCGVNFVYNCVTHSAADTDNSAIGITSNRPFRLCLFNSTISNNGATGLAAVSVQSAFGYTISGDGNSEITSTNSYAVICATQGTATAVVKGVTLTSVNANAITSVYNPLTLIDCTINAQGSAVGGEGTNTHTFIDRCTIISGGNCISQGNIRSGYLRITNSILVSNTGYIVGGGAIGNVPEYVDYIYNCRMRAEQGIIKQGLGNASLYWAWKLEHNIMEVSASTDNFLLQLQDGGGPSSLDTFSNRGMLPLYKAAPINVTVTSAADYNDPNTIVIF